MVLFILKALGTNESYNFKSHKEILKVPNICSSNSAFRKRRHVTLFEPAFKAKDLQPRASLSHHLGPLVIRQLWSCLHYPESFVASAGTAMLGTVTYVTCGIHLDGNYGIKITGVLTCEGSARKQNSLKMILKWLISSLALPIFGVSRSGVG